MKVLIACEESQAVCIEFRNLGIEAYSCDLQECSGGFPEWHITGDALKEAYSGKYQMMIGHPPCTYLSNAGIAYFNIAKYGEKAIARWNNRIEAVEFFWQMWRAPIEFICLENPIGFMSSIQFPQTQVIEPWYFGDPHKKRTGLWLKNLPQLQYSKRDNLFNEMTACDEPEPVFIDNSGKPRYFTDAIKGHGGGHSGRQKARSKTFPGIAKAMADQWSKVLIEHEKLQQAC